MKIIVICGHPNLSQSRVNAEFIRQLDSRDVTLHPLSETHRNYQFDVEYEQSLLVRHDRIVLLFPLYWYSAPALLKKWMDDIYLPGFAYARGGDKLARKELQLVVTVGAPDTGYRAGGFNNFTLDELLRPFQQTAAYTRSIYLPPIAVYESVFLSNSEIEVAVNAVCPRIVGHQERPDEVYEKLLQKAELAQLDLIST